MNVASIGLFGVWIDGYRIDGTSELNRLCNVNLSSLLWSHYLHLFLSDMQIY